MLVYMQYNSYEVAVSYMPGKYFSFFIFLHSCFFFIMMMDIMELMIFKKVHMLCQEMAHRHIYKVIKERKSGNIIYI